MQIDQPQAPRAGVSGADILLVASLLSAASGVIIFSFDKIYRNNYFWNKKI